MGRREEYDKAVRELVEAEEEEHEALDEMDDVFNTRICPHCGYGVVPHISKGVRTVLRCLNPKCGWEGDLL